MFWIAAAAIALVFAWAKAGSPCCSGYTIGPGGMMLPDAIIRRIGPSGPIVYHELRTGSSYVIKRNGRPWVTLTLNTKDGDYELVDPNGTREPVVKLMLDGTAARNVRARTR